MARTLRKSLVSLTMTMTLVLAPIRAADDAARYDPTDAERARWTVADLETLAAALEAYRGDNGIYPRAGTLEEMIDLIEPMYVRKAPLVDAWGTPFVYIVSEDGAEYTLASAGADRQHSPDSWRFEETSGNLNADAVVACGVLTRDWPYR